MVSQSIAYKKATVRSLLILFMLACSHIPALGKPHAGHTASPDAPPPAAFFLLAYQDVSGSGQYKENDFKKKYNHWQQLPPEEKKKLRKRMNQYKKMSPRDQKQYQQKLKQWQRLSPKERRQIQNDLNRWKDLSPAEKEALRRRLNK